MARSISDELHALDRVMYLLEEQSIRHLAVQDTEFANIIEGLYAQVDSQMSQLRTKYA